MHSLFKVSTHLLCVAVVASFLTSSARGESVIWGDRGTFPHRAVMLVLESESREWNLKFGESVGNEVFEERAVKELKSELASLMSAQRGERVTARLAVLRVANGTLLVCPDVSWGWPTQAFGEVIAENTYEEEAEKCNAVVLKMSGQKGEGFQFKVGSEVPEAFAKEAVWNDKVLVEFNVESVQRTRRPRKMMSNYDSAFYDPSADRDEKDDSQRPYFEVRISDLKFIKGIPPADGPRERPRFWPTSGTLPAIYHELMGQIGDSGDWQQVETRLRSFSEYVGRNQPRGVAIGKVSVVNSDSVVLQRELDLGEFPVTANLSAGLDERRENEERDRLRGRPTQRDLGDLVIPMSEVGRDRAMKLKAGDRLLIAFRVTSLGSEMDRTIDGRVQSIMHLQATDLHVGTDEQLNAYLPPQTARPLAVEGDKAESVVSYVAPVSQKGTLRASDSPTEEGFDEASMSVWGDPGSFPEVVRNLLRERDQGIVSAINFDKEPYDAGEKLLEIAKREEGRRVWARLSVMQVTPTEVQLLPDVTWGFPTLPPEEVEGEFQQQHSVIKLQAAGTVEPTERISLTIGKHISAEDAKKLTWNDKVVVDFRVDAISIAAPPNDTSAANEGFGRSESSYERTMKAVTTPPDDTPKTSCTVQVSGVRFSKVFHADLLVSLRMELWPGPGTLPFVLNLTDGGSGFEGITERSPYTDYASLTTFQGAAVFELEDISGDEVRFNSHPLISLTQHAALELSDDHQLSEGMLSVPVGAFPLEERHRIGRQGTRHLLHFEATVIDGSGPVTNQYWNHRVVELRNLRPGTEAELKEAERILPSMEKNAEQFRAAWKRDVEDRRAARAAEIAKAERAKEQAQQNSFFAPQEEVPENNVASEQREADKPAKKSAEPEGWSFRRADWLSRVWPALGPAIGWEALAAGALGVCIVLGKIKRSVVT